MQEESKEKKPRILLVEDEESLVEVMLMNLRFEGYDVSVARDGKQAIDMARQARYDLCILDIMLPKIDGFTVCKTLRLEKNRVPILFLSAKSTGADRVEGLKIGGDDYLTKPFNLEELLLRVSNLLRLHKRAPAEGRELDVYSFGTNQINFSTFEIITQAGKKETLSKREIQLLKFLIDRPGEVVSREEILETVWGYDVYPSTRTIDNYILAFRKYFEKNPKEPDFFHSIRGVGYKFVNE
ncbi:response regulator transcription factor [Cryomorpha ignava]|uniref:Response regulator transcription factor n=1 Tax=Cryomorpha ignava TaxID=101383 RepID=A0A7K3WQ88_9FLAO|nr:response regulator transcription factor [Cryomorpha ignava]NEN22925.1 response regulator transcription factor [Cryomorpha ignava]